MQNAVDLENFIVKKIHIAYTSMKVKHENFTIKV